MIGLEVIQNNNIILHILGKIKLLELNKDDIFVESFVQYCAI